MKNDFKLKFLGLKNMSDLISKKPLINFDTEKYRTKTIIKKNSPKKTIKNFTPIFDIKKLKDTVNKIFEPIDNIEIVDLTYFFEGTLEEYGADDMIFYTDCYLPVVYENEDGTETQNISCGRQFFCQFPDLETLNRCSVMRDYGKNNRNRSWYYQ